MSGVSLALPAIHASCWALTKGDRPLIAKGCEAAALLVGNLGANLSKKGRHPPKLLGAWPGSDHLDTCVAAHTTACRSHDLHRSIRQGCPGVQK